MSKGSSKNYQLALPCQYAVNSDGKLAVTIDIRWFLEKNDWVINHQKGKSWLLLAPRKSRKTPWNSV